MTSRLDDLKNKLAQLDELGRSGVLSPEKLAEARSELERQVLAEVMSPSPAPSKAAAPAPEPAQAPAQAQALAPRVGTRLWLGVSAFVLVVIGAGYAWLGNPGAWGVSPGAPAVAAAGAQGGPQGQHTMEVGQIEKLAQQLAERMKANPTDPEGWMMLGRSYAVLSRFAEAVPAYEKVIELRPQDAQGYADLADAKGMLNGRKLEGEPEQLIQKALKLDPKNLKALSLAGTVAFQRGDFKQTIRHWELAVSLGEPGSELVRNLEAGLSEARERAGLPPKAAAGTSAEAPSSSLAAAAGATVAGKVTLGAALKARVSPEDTVFIFARPAQGAKMPLAILRKQVKDLPFEFTLDDSLAMSPAAKLSSAGQVIVGARISKSGNAMPQPGDLQGLSSAVAVGTQGLVIEIAEEVK